MSRSLPTVLLVLFLISVGASLNFMISLVNM